ADRKSRVRGSLAKAAARAPTALERTRNDFPGRRPLVPEDVRHRPFRSGREFKPWVWDDFPGRESTFRRETHQRKAFFLPPASHPAAGNRAATAQEQPASCQPGPAEGDAELDLPGGPEPARQVLPGAGITPGGRPAGAGARRGSPGAGVLSEGR